jgi:hypothetical protein
MNDPYGRRRTLRKDGGAVNRVGHALSDRIGLVTRRIGGYEVEFLWRSRWTAPHALVLFVSIPLVKAKFSGARPANFIPSLHDRP